MADLKASIESKLSNLLGKEVKVTEKAKECLHRLAESEKNFYSWHLKLLSIVFEVSPEILEILKKVDEGFNNFNFELLDSQIKDYFADKESVPTVVFDQVSDFDNFLAILFVKPTDTGGLGVIYTSSPPPEKHRMIADILTIDHLVAMLFYVLYAGYYESDLAVALLIMNNYGITFSRNNRRYLDSLENIMTKTEL
ncbi:hypothetical protein [Synechocystis sp. PCC 7338]|uniref:hypothetical protein n=1 Tax=Synechocystis sp. PCC 7338 TaxID=2732530 RepID=UPI001BB08F36|nr:hypothetical protein [Synechocystis sp. PCC 7338]QUS62550.1 hypothetical protein HTZ78_17660 [Synechocystis sp. PCC 7338]